MANHDSHNATKPNINETTIQLRSPAESYDKNETVPHRSSWWNVKTWNKKKIAIVVGVIVALLVIIIAVSVVEVRKNRYPDYTALSYSMVDNIYGSSFFDSFDYFTGYDPTFGFVHYLQENQMLAYAGYNLTTANATSAIVKVDNVKDKQTTGRYSVRLTSKKAWDTGLFVFDVKHTPYGCGTWPALWTTNANLESWPASGEMDIMEQVNNATTGNLMTLHTSDGCSMDGVKRKQTGTVVGTNCWNGTDGNAGCGTQGASNTFGAAYNALGGGIMAVELRSAGIRMWSFARSAIPTDITSQTPDPSTWGTATADFPNTECDIPKHFNNQSIIIDIDLCGTWAGATSVYSGMDSCPSNCTDFVANNPRAFDNAYFEFGNFTVYQAKNA